MVASSPLHYFLLKPLESKYPAFTEASPDVHYVIVLGSGHRTNEKLPITSQLVSTAVVRLTEGIRVYRSLEDAKLIVSGYGGRDVTSQALKVKEMAMALGVPDEDIITQSEPRDTKEEALSAKKIVGDNRLVVVTTASHMQRAIYHFENAGVNVIAAPTNHKMLRTKPTIASVPNGQHVKYTREAMHEYIGLLWGRLVALFEKNEA